MQRAIKLRKVYKIMEKQATKITKEPKIPLKKKKRNEYENLQEISY